jgi:hypothetical protein
VVEEFGNIIQVDTPSLLFLGLHLISKGQGSPLVGIGDASPPDRE